MPRKTRVEDDHAAIRVEVMIPVRQNGRAKAMEKARGPAAPVPPPLLRIPRVARLMALAIKFQDMVDRGEVRDYADIARLGHVTRARMSQIMNLLLLAPDIQEDLLTRNEFQGGMVTEQQIRPVATLPIWRDQRNAWSILRQQMATISTDHQLTERCGELEAKQTGPA